MKKNKIGFTIIMCLLLIMVTIGVTYAAFSFTKEGTVENSLETGTIVLTYTEGKTAITLNEAYPMSDEQGKLLTGENNVFDFTVQANLSRKVPIGYEVAAVKIPITDMTPLEDDEVKLYLEKAIDPETSYQEILAPTHFLPRDEQSEIGSPVGSMIIDSGTFINQGTTIHNYRLRLWVADDADLSSGVAKKYGVKINVYAKQDVLATTVDNRNDNIIAIYQYDQTKESDTFCVTGEEATCVELTIAPSTYKTGTIIKYKVNATEEKYFHVVSDNGNTLTLQQRENTVSDTNWYEGRNNNTKGPVSTLPLLEEATNGWTNVLDQTYTLGTTIIRDNAYTGCSYDDNTKTFSCTTNSYTLPERTAKARMITLQETSELGCTLDKRSCPVWVYNYLWQSVAWGGTINDPIGGAVNEGYWMSTAVSSTTAEGWGVLCYGNISGYLTNIARLGARAVVVVNK